jgi:hypothetical protein
VVSPYAGRRDWPELLPTTSLRARRGAVRAWLLRLLHEDRQVARLVGAFCVWQLGAALWDLPCMYGWENDGVAPRDVFGGLAHNLQPGSAHRYPLFHYVLLAVPCLPIVLAAVATAPELSALSEAVVSVPAMTGIALVAKLLSISMGAVLVLALARVTRRLFGARAGFWGACFAVTNLSLSYYTRSTNLDGPYLMWGVLAADRLLDVLEHGRRDDYVALSVCAALSIATKDQAYSLYVLSLPLYLLLRGSRLPAGHAHWLHLRRAALWGALCLGALGGALLNPAGFLQRLRLLSGPNSQDWRQYDASLQGVLANLYDLGAALPEFFWPVPVLLLVALGGVLALAQRPGRGRLHRRTPRCVPLAFAVSSLLTFTLVTARCEHRFVLPLGAFAACYAGHAAATLERWARGARLAGAGLCALLALSGAQTLALQLTQWGDARREVEQWLARLPARSTVESYGHGVYLPRFDRFAGAPYSVQRVGPEPGTRARISGVRELYEAYGNVAQRAPDVLVITEGFARRFVPRALGGGRAASSELARYQSDADAGAFFASARAGELPGYALVLEARPSLPGWATRVGLTPIEIHGSTAQRAWILVRRDARGPQLDAGHNEPSLSQPQAFPDACAPQSLAADGAGDPAPQPGT